MPETSARHNPGKRSESVFGLRESRVVFEQDSHLRMLLSNLKDFLTERPAKFRPGSRQPFFTYSSFGSGLIGNLAELMRPIPRSSRGESASAFLVPQGASFPTFWQNLRDAIFPPKLPPIQVSSKPVKVPEIWTPDPQFKRVQALSLAMHIVLLVLIIVPLIPEIMSPPTTRAESVLITPLDVSPYVPKLPPGSKKAGGGGGGGEHNPIPASRGKLPKFDFTRFTPPAVKPPENPRLAMTPTVLGQPDLHLPSPNMANYGDPLSKVITESSGPGGGGGIGTGTGGGVGSGSGGGVGPGYGWNTGGGYPQAGTNGYGAPVCVYCPNPAFSDEAVKAKYQGSVTLQAVITADGRATNIQVVKGVGLGLDEKAVEAVRNWRFKPAPGPDGRPSAVVMLIEVTFRLY